MKLRKQEHPSTQQKVVNIQARRVAPPGVSPQRDTYMDLKTRVQNRLLAELDPSMDINRVNDVQGNYPGVV